MDFVMDLHRFTRTAFGSYIRLGAIILMMSALTVCAVYAAIDITSGGWQWIAAAGAFVLGCYATASWSWLLASAAIGRASKGERWGN